MHASARLIITEAANISEQAIGWINTPGIYTEEQIDAWKQVIEPVQARQTPMFIQLWHMGRASHESFRRSVSPGRTLGDSDQQYLQAWRRPDSSHFSIVSYASQQLGRNGVPERPAGLAVPIHCPERFARTTIVDGDCVRV